MQQSVSAWSDTVIQLVALAGRLEREGQYNVAKLARAAVDAMTRQGAYHIDLSSDKHLLAEETEKAAAALIEMGVSADLATALRLGAAGLREGRFTLVDETPDAFVCRTCGFPALGEPAPHCPSAALGRKPSSAFWRSTG